MLHNHRLALLASVTLLAAACRDPEAIAIDAIGALDIRNIDLHQVNEAGSYTFEGWRGDDECTGTVEVKDYDNAGTAAVTSECLPPPGEKTGELRPGTAAEIVKQARRCDGGDAHACADLGARYQRGDGVPKNLDYATGLWAETCREGAGLACHSLALVFEAGGTDAGAVTKLMVEGCDLGWSPACGQATRRLYNDDERPDNGTMVRTARRGCEADDVDSCLILGILLAHGVEVPLDLPQARRVLMQACSAGKEAACTLVEEL